MGFKRTLLNNDLEVKSLMVFPLSPKTGFFLTMPWYKDTLKDHFYITNHFFLNKSLFSAGLVIYCTEWSR